MHPMKSQTLNLDCPAYYAIYLSSLKPKARLKKIMELESSRRELVLSHLQMQEDHDLLEVSITEDGYQCFYAPRNSSVLTRFDSTEEA